MLDQSKRDQLNQIIGRMKDNREDDASIRAMVEQFKAKYDALEMAAPTGGIGGGHEAEGAFGERDPQGYQQPEYMKAQQSGTQPGAWQALAPVAQFAGDVAQSLSTGPFNAAIQGVQDSHGNPISAVSGILKNEAKNLASPFYTFENPVQSSATSLERMGVDNTPQPPPMRYPGEVFPGGNEAPITGLAEQLGITADMVTPAVAAGPLIRGASELTKAAGSAKTVGREALSGLKSKGLNSQGMRTAAEKSILDNYAPRLRAEFAPPDPTPGGLEKASSDLAETLKKSDLLYAPEKAKIKLNAGLDKVGGAIEKTVKQAAEADVSVNVKDVVDGYATSTRNILKKTGKNAAEIEEIEGKVLPKIQKIIDNLGPDELGNIPVDKGVEFRRALQNMVKNWDGDNKNVAQLVAKKLSSSMNEKIVASHPTYGPRLSMLNERYAALKDAEPMIDEGYAKAYAKATGVRVNDRGVPLTKQGVIDRALEKVLNPRESLLKMKPDLAERIANDRYLPSGSASPLPEYTPPPSTVTPEDLRALRQPFGQDAGAPVGPGYLPPRQPGGRPALDKPPTYIQGQPKEGLPPRVPQNTRRPLEDKPPTYMREPAEGLPPRDPKYPRRPLEATPDPEEVFLQVLADAKGWPPGLNESRIKMLLNSYNQSKPNAKKAKILALLKDEWSKAVDTPRIRKLKMAIEKATDESTKKRLMAQLATEDNTRQ